MLFNSDIYIFIFLPIAFGGYFLLSRYFSPKIKNFWLVAISFFFYGFWNPVYIPLLLFSLLFNFYIGKTLSKKQSTKYTFLNNKKVILVLGVTINLLLLGFFKYADFTIKNINWLFDLNISLLHLVLPLAISFFTFQQIAYLVDSYKHLTHEYDFMNYAVFVTFFPQLIAGPIVHHKEMLPQFVERKNGFINYRNISIGLFIFFIGLVKKVGIADTFAVWANAGYAYEGMLTFYDAWVTSFAYTFQLYFDFSGYTDMAIGSALLFNIKLPLNFNSPYKALNIQDFWRRWHMTLSRFLRDYIYIPLGGNRRGPARMYIAIFLVFFLGGLWHGASWTFVLWGMLHGGAAISYRLWSQYSPVVLPKVMAWFLTFNFVNITWVFFRAETFQKAYAVLESMFGGNGFGVNSELFVGKFRGVPRLEGFSDLFHTLLATNFGEVLFRPISIWIIITLAIVVFAKNSNELSNKFKLTIRYLVILIILYVVGIYNLSGFSEFLYFNF